MYLKTETRRDFKNRLKVEVLDALRFLIMVPDHLRNRHTISIEENPFSRNYREIKTEVQRNENVALKNKGD